MLGMCGRLQPERRRADERASPNGTRWRSATGKKIAPRTTRVSARPGDKKPGAGAGFARVRRSSCDVEHPAVAEMVWSVVGGTVERSAAGRRRSMNRTGGLVHRLVCI